MMHIFTNNIHNTFICDGIQIVEFLLTQNQLIQQHSLSHVTLAEQLLSLTFSYSSYVSSLLTSAVKALVKAYWGLFCGGPRSWRICLIHFLAGWRKRPRNQASVSLCYVYFCLNKLVVIVCVF